MGWFGKLTLGSLGLFMGGPLGAIAGGALGHLLFDKEDNIASKTLPFGQADQAQAAYFISLFSILGKLAKADGVVSREEINIVNQFLSTLRLPEQQKQFAKNIFNEAKKSPYSIDDFASQLYQVNHNQPTILLSFMAPLRALLKPSIFSVKSINDCKTLSVYLWTSSRNLSSVFHSS